MAFVTLNNFDVEHASSMIVYENLMPEIQHINGKGVIDKFTMSDDIESVNSIDIMRVLPLAPKFRQLGAKNGGWHNTRNEGGFNNAPQSVHYTVPINLVYDEIIPIYDTQQYSNPIALETIVSAQVIQTVATIINVVTFAKQIEAYFTDNFTKGSATPEEVGKAVFSCDEAKSAQENGSFADAFITANTSIARGIPELGAFRVPVDERQAFISNNFDRIMKRQYMTNASTEAVKILSNGYINPWKAESNVRIDDRTGLAGMYDGIGLFILNDMTRNFVYVALGLTSSDTAEMALLDKIEAMVVYAGATLRGIVGPSIEVNKNPYGRGIVLAPYLKLGVECISGKGIKMVVNKGWSAANIDTITAKIKFTPIDGVTVTGADAFEEGTFNDGTSN